MTNNRTIEISAGILFFVATASFLIGSEYVEPTLKAGDYLAGGISRGQMIAGLSLELVNAAAVVGIAVLLYTRLRKHGLASASSYLSARLFEGVLLLVAMVGPLILLAIDKQGIGSADAPTLSLLSKTLYFQSFGLAMAALAFGSLFLTKLLYQTNLVPRWLSIVGFVGYLSLLIWALSNIFGLPTSMALFAPGAIFEVIFPLWLIFKGFKEPATTTH